MKKTIIMLLTTIMALSLSACGGESKVSDNSSPDSEAVTQSETELPESDISSAVWQAESDTSSVVDPGETTYASVPAGDEEVSSEAAGTEEPAQVTELELNSVVETELFDFCVTDFYYYEKATDPDRESSAILAPKGYCYGNIVLDAKYKGKSDVSFPYAFGSAILNYGDGYTFEAERSWFYYHSLETWLNSGDIKVLTPNFGIAYNFEIPLEVRDNTEEPLSVTFFVNGGEYEYVCRPAAGEAGE